MATAASKTLNGLHGERAGGGAAEGDRVQGSPPPQGEAA